MSSKGAAPPEPAISGVITDWLRSKEPALHVLYNSALVPTKTQPESELLTATQWCHGYADGPADTRYARSS